MCYLRWLLILAKVREYRVHVNIIILSHTKMILASLTHSVLFRSGELIASSKLNSLYIWYGSDYCGSKVL